MNIKFYVLALTLVGSFFIHAHNASAQEANFCCEFSATNQSEEVYNYCQMTTSCTKEQMSTAVTGSTLVEGSVKFFTGLCVDDNNKNVGDKLGTHCQTVGNTNTTTNTTCDANTSLADCIAKRMPNKNGGVGTNNSPAGLIDGVAKIINTVLGLMGLVFTIMLVYAGIQWIHYGGDSDGKKRSTKRMKNAVIGLAITLSAYSITAFVINNL